MKIAKSNYEIEKDGRFFVVDEIRYYSTMEQTLEFIARDILYPGDWGIARDLEKRNVIRNKIHLLADENGLTINKKFPYHSFEYAPANCG